MLLICFLSTSKTFFLDWMNTKHYVPSTNPEAAFFKNAINLGFLDFSVLPSTFCKNAFHLGFLDFGVLPGTSQEVCIFRKNVINFGFLDFCVLLRTSPEI